MSLIVGKATRTQAIVFWCWCWLPTTQENLSWQPNRPPGCAPSINGFNKFAYKNCALL